MKLTKTMVTIAMLVAFSAGAVAGGPGKGIQPSGGPGQGIQPGSLAYLLLPSWLSQ